MMGQNILHKVIFTATHSGKRPIGTFTDEIDHPECEEVERNLAWINAGPGRKEMIWRLKYSCGRCKGVIYTGITKRAEEE